MAFSTLTYTDIRNAYLESYTAEKVVFIAGPEFGELEGHTMVIVKAQYGLKSSGKCWHKQLHDVLVLKDMGFFPSKAARRRHLDVGQWRSLQVHSHIRG